MAGGLSGWNGLPAVAALIESSVDDMVVQACWDIAAAAQGFAPEDTGFLKSSIYTSTKDGSNYGQGITQPPGDAYQLEEVDKPPAHTGYVAVAANYGIYVEFGTRKAGAQPYLIPAVEKVRPSFSSGNGLRDALARFKP
jgi:HK97 gp10 family phage protein